MVDFLKKGLWAWAILVTALAGLLVAFVQMTDEQKGAVITFAGVLAGLLTRAGQKQIPPGLELVDGQPKSVRRISVIPKAGLIFGVLFALCSCTRAQEAKALPALDFAQAVAQKAGTVLDFVEPLLPPGDAQVATARAAQAAGDLGKVFDVARPLLERVAAGGEDVPQQLVADVVIGAQAAKAIEQGVRALDGRNPDGTLKQDGGP
jgi:hypothetical protein